MAYFAVMFFFLVFIIEFRKYKTLVAPSVCFCAFWAIISFAASLQLYNLNSAETKTWLVIILGVLSFVLGTKIKVMGQSSQVKNACKGDLGGYLPVKLFWIAFIVVGVYRTIIIIQTLYLLQRGYSMSLVRDASFGISNIDGYLYIDSALMRKLLSAIDMILIATGIEYFIKGGKKNWKYVLASSYLVIGEAVGAGGRWTLVYFLTEFFVGFCIMLHQKYGNRIRISSRVKRNGIFVPALLAIGSIILVFFRINAGRNINKLGHHLYGYLCGCVPLLDLKIKSIDRNNIYSFGFAGQYGFWSFAIPALRIMSGFSFPLFDETVNQIMTGQEVLNIGWGWYNAFTTCFYYLYADFRYVGVFIGMFVFGLLAGNVFCYAQSNQNSIVPYLIISQLLIKSIQIYAFGSAEYVFAFIIMIVIFILRKYKLRFR